MQWFRWYHGTTSDPKFAGVARRAQAPLELVIAIWAMILEDASSAVKRGSYFVDADSIAQVLSRDTETVERVLREMRKKRLIGAHSVPKFQVRNPKGDDSIERVRRYRQKRNGPETAVTRDVTRDSHVTVTPVTRLDVDVEKSTEIKEDTSSTPRASALRTWLNSGAAAVDRMAASADHGPTWEDGLYGLYGPSGTDEQVWKGVPDDNRAGIIAVAIDRFAGEGKKYNGRYFRRFVEVARDEQLRSGDAGYAHAATGGVTPGSRPDRPGKFDHLVERSGG